MGRRLTTSSPARSLVSPASLISLAAFASLASFATGCGSNIRRFPLRDPLTVDNDVSPISFPCKPDPKDPKHNVCIPEEYESSFAWDAADNTIFRPITRFFAVDPAGEAANVNSFDEVPDSSWFTGRIGAKPMSPDEAALGSCDDKVLDPSDADGSWLIDMGKPNGANPGFRVKVEGVGKFMLKADPKPEPERATGAASIAARLYYAAGFFAPCDSVVYVRRSLLKLKPGLRVTDNSGVAKDFDEKALQAVFDSASKRPPATPGGEELVRLTASRWLPGRTVGPFTYAGVRNDDSNDIIRHEDRRELRGARLFAAWLNHFDSREQNSMITWMADDPKDPDSSPGHFQHWYIDLGDCFGSVWNWDQISRRLGFSYYLDIPYLLEDFVTLGIPSRPWEHAQRSKDGDIFGYFHSRDFDPEMWRGGYPNPAFGRMSERDGAWMARIIARFTPEHVAAAVRVGDYTQPKHSAFLEHHLMERRDIILRRYLDRLSPLADVRVDGDTLCATDLARKTKVFGASEFHYAATEYTGPRYAVAQRPAPTASADGGVCVPLTHANVAASEPPDSAERYVVVDIENGHAHGLLRAHLYDLGGARGYKLVGIERPDGLTPPS